MWKQCLHHFDIIITQFVNDRSMMRKSKQWRSMDSGVIGSVDTAQLQDLEKAGFDRLRVLIDFMEGIGFIRFVFVRLKLLI